MMWHGFVRGRQCMRNFVISFFCIAAPVPSFAQEDSVRLIHGLPVVEDTVSEEVTPTPRLDSAEKISPRDLPPRVMRALQRKDVYRGWERGRIFFEREAGLYRIEIPVGAVTRVIGLDTAGRPVTYDEYDNK